MSTTTMSNLQDQGMIHAVTKFSAQKQLFSARWVDHSCMPRWENSETQKDQNEKQKKVGISRPLIGLLAGTLISKMTFGFISLHRAAPLPDIVVLHVHLRLQVAQRRSHLSIYTLGPKVSFESWGMEPKQGKGPGHPASRRTGSCPQHSKDNMDADKQTESGTRRLLLLVSYPKAPM